MIDGLVCVWMWGGGMQGPAHVVAGEQMRQSCQIEINGQDCLVVCLNQSYSCPAVS